MAVVLRRFSDITVSTRPTAAVAIKAVSSAQRHIGLVYSKGENLWLLHLAWHYDLRNEFLGPTYFLVEHKFTPPRMRQVAARCRQIAKANPRGLPFAFSYPNGCFDGETGRYLFASSQIGLTCATFVLAVFEVAGLKLLEMESWRERDDDDQWQQGVLSHLRGGLDDGKVTQSHIHDVERQVGAFRCRPEEVAGSTASETHPIQFELAVRLGEQVLARMN